MIFRNGISSDCKGITSLWKQLMHFHAHINEIYSLSPEADAVFVEHLLKKINDPMSIVAVCENNALILGYAIGYIDYKVPIYSNLKFGYISDIAVDASFRRMGVGNSLIEYIFEWFKSNEIYDLELRVSSQNTIAFDMWTNHGFIEYAKCMHLKINKD